VSLRGEAKINLILDALVTCLKGIDGAPDAYLTKPARVKRWSPDPLAEAFPLLLVRAARFGPNEPQTGEQHDGQAVIEVEMFCGFKDRVDDPDRELHRLAADVLYAVQNDWQLKNGGTDPAVPSLQIHVIEGYEPSRTMNAATGHASATIGFQAHWPWDASQP
jgi:hypothetical protein